MSQSSEMTNSLKYLGYPDATIGNTYYTAQVAPGIGVCVAFMSGQFYFMQFFPWECRLHTHATGHERYACFTTAKSSLTAAQNGELFSKWPFELCDVDDGILVIKCLIEETIKTLEPIHDDHQRSPADPPAGKAVE